MDPRAVRSKEDKDSFYDDLSKLKSKDGNCIVPGILMGMLEAR